MLETESNCIWETHHCQYFPSLLSHKINHFTRFSTNQHALSYNLICLLFYPSNTHNTFLLTFFVLISLPNHYALQFLDQLQRGVDRSRQRFYCEIRGKRQSLRVYEQLLRGHREMDGNHLTKQQSPM